MKQRFGRASALSVLAVSVALIAFCGWWARHHIGNETVRNVDQTTLRDKITKDLSDIDMIDIKLAYEPVNADQLAAHQRTIENIVCREVQQVRGNSLPMDQNAWITEHCADGHYR